MIRRLLLATVCSLSLSAVAQDAPAKELTVIIAPTNPMAFATTTLTVKAGEKVKLTLDNQANFIQPHNFVLVKPGKDMAIGTAAASLPPDPTQMPAHNYIPESEDILAHTKLVPSLKQETIEFTAPTEPGAYPYICTFPGHFMVMKGVLTVE